MWRPVLVAALLAGLVAGQAGGQAEDLGAPEGAERTAHRTRGFDQYALPVGPFLPDQPVVTELSGRIDWSAYRMDGSGVTVPGVLGGYRTRLAAQGFDLVLLECTGDACGGFDFRFGVAMLPPPAMLIDVRDFGQLSLGRAEPEAYASVLVSKVQGRVFVQTVLVEPAESDEEGDVEIEAAPRVTEETRADPLPQDERALLDKLIADGHVRVEGLEFQTGGATLSAGSGEALDLLATLLSRDSELRVAIVGHSDNEGGLDANIALSQRRAQAVMKALIARGVPKSQVEARGIGYLAPLISNATPEGRAMNRRVELVLR